MRDSGSLLGAVETRGTVSLLRLEMPSRPTFFK